MDYTQDELNDIVQLNELYWKTNGKEGERANLSGADLSGAKLTNADLWGANLSGADLTDAVLTDAKLTNAILWGANLTGADLTDAKLANADLTGVKHNAETIWPDGFDMDRLKADNDKVDTPQTLKEYASLQCLDNFTTTEIINLISDYLEQKDA